MYTVIGSRKSRGFRVLWMLEEMVVPYEHDPSGPRSATASAVNPSGKIPILLVDDVPITDSVAIMAYLGDAHNQLTAPAGTIERAKQNAMTLRILDEFDALLWTASRHSFVLPEEERVREIKPALKVEYQRNLTRLFQEIETPFVIGEHMTIPDILLTHCMRWAEVASFPEPQDKAAAYLDKMQDRAALQRTLQLP